MNGKTEDCQDESKELLTTDEHGFCYVLIHTDFSKAMNGKTGACQDESDELLTTDSHRWLY